MKNIEMINTIVCNMDENRFNKILDAEYDYWDVDQRVSRNGRKRLVYNLRLEGLTIEDWFRWHEG